MKFKSSTKESQKGFTLIELLVVIAIIGILSSVVLASMNTARKKARDARRQADLKSMQLALESYYDTNSAYPSVTGEVAVSSTTLSALTSGGFITVLADDPSSTGDYYYESDGTEYCIGAVLEGTVPATDNTCPSTTQLTGNSVNWQVGQ
jgi:prepilin-type N-terminal cleavage/methylation domain-containing protein